MKNIIIYFLTGGIVTTLIVVLEESNFRILSGLATLVPIFTLVAYLFIGASKGGLAVSQHATMVLTGTLVSWVPYMLTVIILAPRYGTLKAVIWGMLIFFVLALIYLLIVNHYHLFQ
jgi:uncharacterized membrane protein (GlpM family)